MTDTPIAATVAGGLTSAEAALRLSRYGPNEAAPTRRLSSAVQLLHLFANPLVIILLVASGISASLHQPIDAVIIATMVLLGVTVNFWQSYRSQRAADRLRASVSPTATVRRDGAWQEVPIRQVVPGDVIRLTAGDLVPADARLLESRDLAVQQSMLTGESLPADKAVTPGTVANGAGASRPTSSSEGPDASDLVFLGTSVVSGTGVALALATGQQTLFGDIATRLASRVPETEFEHGLRRFSLLILRTTVALVLFILLISIALHRDAFDSLLFAVALGVGLTPEFLPMIAAVTLTQGALRMAKHKVIVKHLPAIQNFGSIDVFCSDKTGTLTTGTMQLARVLDAAGAPSARPLSLAAVNARYQTGIRSALDAAILKETAEADTAWQKVDEMPFDFERRRLSVVVRGAQDASRCLLITKGAAESILPLVTSTEYDSQVVAADEASRHASSAVATQLSGTGLRVLAVAYRWLEPREVYNRADEAELTLAGFVGFADPALPDAGAAIADLRRDGVAVKILTGDNDLVARHICGQIGLDATRVVTGEEIARVDDAGLEQLAEDASVFARVSPAQKNRIILALKRRGHVVGFMGDGINDAPSLHAADVGISVMSATDVAREAADVILGQASLRVLHQGILEGRRASGNMMKYLPMGTSSNFGNMFSMAAASVFLPFLPMLPTQILLNNFLYDLAQVTIPGDNVDEGYLRKPQRWDMRVIRDFMIFIGPISSLFDFLTFFILLRLFHASETLFHTGWFVESLATQTLVLFVIRTMGNPLRSRPSRALTITTLLIVAVALALPVSPLAPLLGFTRPPLSYLLFLVPATVTYLALVELAKRVLVRRLGLL